MTYDKYFERTVCKLETLNNIYASLVYEKVGELENLTYFETPEHFREIPNAEFLPLKSGYVWGGEWQNMWICGEYKVPKEFNGKPIYLLPRTESYEILVFKNSLPKGIINSKNDYIGGMHCVFPLCQNAKDSEIFSLAFECYAGHYCPGTQPYDNYGIDTRGDFFDAFKRRFNSIDVVLRNDEIWNFIFNLKALLHVARQISQENYLHSEAQFILEKVFDVIIQYPEDFSRAEINESVLKANEIMKTIFSTKNTDLTHGRVGVIGQSHMDTAWLWPVSETIRKCARTYANAVSLMDIYPEYSFIQSSMLHLDWMRRYYPSIFESIKQKIKLGKYEPNGGIWVECDCNITSGESIIRQFLKAQNFTRKYFDYTADCFWLPDTFGYNAQIPQIIKACEAKYFYTTKISWNDLNSFPVDTFIWSGLDKSEVLTHFNIINSSGEIYDIINAQKNISKKSVYDAKLLGYGLGDGGGGPTPGNIESIRRAEKLSGLPNIFYTSASGFMKDIEKNAKNLPTYTGELYLELHRGTLTQMHDIKRNNRKAEFALHDLDYFLCLAEKVTPDYLSSYYETLLLNQFHDILPGSSIERVNVESCKQMSELIENSKEKISLILDDILDNCDKKLTVFNTLSFARNDTLYIENSMLYPKDYVSQKVTDICGRDILLVNGITLDGFDSKTIELSEIQNSKESPFIEHGLNLETPFYNVTFDENGFISYLYDKESNRQITKNNAPPLGTFYTAEDVPARYDNWDIDNDTISKLKPKSTLTNREISANGAIEYRVKCSYKIGKSSILHEETIFKSNDKRIDFHILLDWQDKHFLLKKGFDVDINSDFANNEIQFGHIKRPTTRNNSLESAKFEVCNHKWSDISESRYGVAILNDCKYGISIENSNMQITLHRGGIHPDATGDYGICEMIVSLCPHSAALNCENVIKPSYMLNIPHVYHKGKLAKNTSPMFNILSENIICETVKKAENIENAIILRLYECERNKTNCKIKISNKFKNVYLTNMLEDKICKIDVTNNEISIDFHPFKIITILLEY